MFYAALLVYPQFRRHAWARAAFMAAALASTAFCVLLAYILVAILSDVCVVCVSTYFVNALVLALAVRDFACYRREKTE